MNTRPIALFAAAATLTASCIHVEDDEPYYDPYTYEVEPNDHYWNAQGIGPISVGEQILLRGHIDDFGFDRYDGFAFQSAVPMDIEFALYADDPNADFDVALFDPYTLTTVATWESGSDPESGYFSVWSPGYEFHLVVSSFFGSGGYTFEVRGTPLAWHGDGANGFAAQSVSERVERAIDWQDYADLRPVEADVEIQPQLQITTLELDPPTDRVRAVQVRRVVGRDWMETDL